MRGDPVRLAQVFSNLLNNAAKYTPPGGRVAGELAARRRRHAVVERARHRHRHSRRTCSSRIFDMFAQVSGTAQGGAGRAGHRPDAGQEPGRAARRQRRSAHSDGPGEGSDLRRPAAAGEEHADGAVPRTIAAAGRMRRAAIEGVILVVDDNRDAADSLADLLRTMGAATLVAYSGEEALQLAAAERDRHRRARHRHARHGRLRPRAASARRARRRADWC